MHKINPVADRARRWLVSWAKIGDGLIEVVTLTFFSPDWTMDAAESLARWRLRQRKKKESEPEDE